MKYFQHLTSDTYWYGQNKTTRAETGLFSQLETLGYLCQTRHCHCARTWPHMTFLQPLNVPGGTRWGRVFPKGAETVHFSKFETPAHLTWPSPIPKARKSPHLKTFWLLILDVSCCGQDLPSWSSNRTLQLIWDPFLFMCVNSLQPLDQKVMTSDFMCIVL